MILTVILASLIGYVNPFIGTDAHGHTFPGAAYPFGMIQLSPDTRPDAGDWDGCSGYHYSDSKIYGFSHTHLSGTGCDDLCDVLVMPATGLETAWLDREQYASPFSHYREKAEPGYYEVWLEKPKVQARMTVSRRSAMHEYTFPSGVAPQLVIDLRHRDSLLEWSINAEGFIIYGHRKSASWSQDQDVYFAIYTSRPIRKQEIRDGVALITFYPRRFENSVTLRVGISSVDVAHASANAGAEEFELFGEMRRSTAAVWDAYLATVPCPYEDLERRKVFYTALYHTAIHPNLYSDATGTYRGMDRKVYQADDWERFTVFSLWDTFRAEHPLLFKTDPWLSMDFINSMLAIYEEGGKLPVWELDGYETDCMIGYHSAPVFAEALQQGLVDFNVDKALEALVASSTKAEFGLDSFRSHGLVLADDEHESVSKTLEYAYDDWCVAQVAGWLLAHPDRTGYSRYELQEVYDSYMESSQYWRNVFDPSTGFMRARLNGRWLSPFDPREVNNHYTEGNAWQYSFFVPHDVVGLMSVMGGRKGFVERLDSLFAAPQQTTGRVQADLTGMIGQYAHGNEPSHHIPFLYALAGRPDKTSEIVDRIMRELYSSAPDGLPGNEDCGQMSAWYVLAAIGEYPVCPGAPVGSLTFVPKTIVVNPVFEYESEIIKDSMVVSVSNIDKGCRAWYRVGTSGEFVPYEGAFAVYDADTLECYSESPAGITSFVTRAVLRKMRTDVTVSLGAQYLRQYSAGGPEGLIDGTRGPINWRTGGWQGYQAVDFEATVDLKGEREVHEIGSGWLQDARSWIWLPRYVEILGTSDGVNYQVLSKQVSPLAEDDMTVKVVDFTVRSEKPLKLRGIKIRAGRFGQIPSWHPGAGGEGIIFTDEIWVN